MEISKENSKSKGVQEISKFELLKELAKGYSVQSKISNTYWLSLIVISVISITTISNTSHVGTVENLTNKLDLPFGLGKIEPEIFPLISGIMISVLSVVFASVFLQAQRTRKLVQILIESISKEDIFIHNIHLQDLFDSIIEPTLNRVAPISQSILGVNQFFNVENKEKKQNKFYRILAIVLYVFLKIAAILIFFGLPLYSLFVTAKYIYKKGAINNWEINTYLFYFFILISLIIFLILIYLDMRYLVTVFKKIWKVEKKNSK